MHRLAFCGSGPREVSGASRGTASVLHLRASRRAAPSATALSLRRLPRMASFAYTTQRPAPSQVGWRQGWSLGGKSKARTFILTAGLTAASLAVTQRDGDEEKGDRRASEQQAIGKGAIPSRMEDEIGGVERIKWLWSKLSYSQKILVPILATNALVFLAWQPSSRRLRTFLINHFMCSPEHLRARKYHTLLTSAFSHATFMHFGFNMMALWTIAPSVVDILGTRHFLLLYVTGAVVASATGATWQQLRGRPLPSLGASGALMAVLWVFVSAFPDNKMSLIFLPFIPIPAINLAAGIAMIDIIGALRGWRVLDHAAHLGGAAVGLAAFYSLRQMNALEKWNEYGTKSLPDGSVYEGYFRGGQMHGKGRYTTSDGLTLTGDFKNGTANGYCVLKTKAGQVMYQGHMKNGTFHGSGALYNATGPVYIGDFQDGVFWGEGVRFFGHDVKLVGQYEAGRPSGPCRFFQEETLIFDGVFSDNGDGRWRATGTLYPPEEPPAAVVWVEGENPVPAP